MTLQVQMDLEVVSNAKHLMTLYCDNNDVVTYCDNSGAIINSKELRSHKREKYIERKYHLLREIVQKGDVIVRKIASIENLVDLFTKALLSKVFEEHLEGMRLKMYICFKWASGSLLELVSN